MARKHRKITPSIIIQKLETRRRLFGPEPIDLVKTQEEKATQILTLWRDADPRTRGWARNRARTLMESVYINFSVEVFFLCSLSTSITELAKIDPIICASSIREWWSEADHPAGLTHTAKSFETRHWDVFSAIGSQPPPTAVQLTLSELFRFLETKASCQNLQLICHLFGQPLPSIDLDINGRSAKIELSLRASEALIQHLLISRDRVDESIEPRDVDKSGRPDLAV
ncbi:uncharacterized protein BDV14DRAFT_182304 [Aspergillus stella-maris]|uniref:uncharacterized protein n=1 Tax=Aspergillus stella-maris TaxID=1810926 RepID=UPI003CCD7F31